MVKKMGAVVALLLAMVVVPAAPAYAEDEVVYIVNLAGNRCLDAPAEWNGENRSPIQLWECYPPTQYNQMWRIRKVGSEATSPFQLINVASGRCLDVRDWGTVEGVPVQLYNCFPDAENHSNQLWNLHTSSTPGGYVLRGRHSSQVLDADAHRAAGNGAAVQIWYYYSTPTQLNQRWVFRRADEF